MVHLFQKFKLKKENKKIDFADIKTVSLWMKQHQGQIIFFSTLHRSIEEV